MGRQIASRVGAGVVWMRGGDACVAQTSASLFAHPLAYFVDEWWGRLRRPDSSRDFPSEHLVFGGTFFRSLID